MEPDPLPRSSADDACSVGESNDNTHIYDSPVYITERSEAETATPKDASDLPTGAPRTPRDATGT